MEPLDTYEKLINWECPNDKSKCCTINFSERKLQEYSGLPVNGDVSSKRNKVLCCHDMNGGYLDDNIIQGNSNVHAYRFYHWDLIDTFIYFSHHFVTIPPLGWTRIAHINGVQCLGTLIIEPGERSDHFQRIFASNNFEVVAAKLDEIRKFYNFDGWLINLECMVKEPSSVQYFVNNICEFLSRLREAGNEVIWYDAITDKGDLCWQNGLSDRNSVFFNHCGNIFTNYCWNVGNLDQSLEKSMGRGNQVYVGIDCYGRGCPGGGGFNCNDALKLIDDASNRRCLPSHPKLSIALFAQAWCYAKLPEAQIKHELNLNIWRFFHRMHPYLYSILDDQIVYRQLPEISLDKDKSFDTCFDLGQGYKLYKDGWPVDNVPYNNILDQQVTPSGTFSLPNDQITVKFLPCREFSYTGYSCTEMVTDFTEEDIDTKWPITVDIFRLGVHVPSNCNVVMSLWLGLSPEVRSETIWSCLQVGVTFSLGDSRVSSRHIALDQAIRRDCEVRTATVIWYYFRIEDLCGDLGNTDSMTLRKVVLDISNIDCLRHLSKCSLYFGRLTISSAN